MRESRVLRSTYRVDCAVHTCNVIQGVLGRSKRSLAVRLLCWKINLILQSSGSRVRRGPPYKAAAPGAGTVCSATASVTGRATAGAPQKRRSVCHVTGDAREEGVVRDADEKRAH